MTRVAAELDLLSAPGEELHTDGELATVNLYTRDQLALRSADFGIAYLERQPNIATDGLAAVVTAGPPGVGKSTILARDGFLPATSRDIDADLVKELVLRRALQDGIFDGLLMRRLSDGRPVRPMELATLVHRESTAITQNLTEVCMRRGENVIIQGTLAWHEQPYSILSALQTHGYGDLAIISAATDLAVALDRALVRWWSGRVDSRSELGGRFMPSALIRDMYLPGGGTKCRANAEFMFEISEIPATRLISYSDGDLDSESGALRQKFDGEEIRRTSLPQDENTTR